MHCNLMLPLHLIYVMSHTRHGIQSILWKPLRLETTKYDAYMKALVKE